MEFLHRFRRGKQLRQAQRFSDGGNPAAALRILTAANRQRPDIVLEREIVDTLLHMAGSVADSSPTTSFLHQSSGQQDNPPMALRGPIPEIGAADFSAGILREAIGRYGYLIVRSYFDSTQANVARQCVDEAFVAAAAAPEGDSGESPWFYRSPHFSAGKHQAYSKRSAAQRAKPSGSTRVIDSPRSVVTLLDLYGEKGLEPVLRQYFGEAATIAARKWVFRLIEPIPMEQESIGGGWHQDGQFMGKGVTALNMWVALSECGEGTKSPGIALLPRRFEEILEYGTRGAKMDWVVGSELVAELAEAAPVVCPHFYPGDALFFDHFSLHRSGHGPHQDLPRYALESWFYAASGTGGNVALPLVSHGEATTLATGALG